MSTLTIILEIALGTVGVAIAIGSPLVGMRLHHREELARTGLPLVGTSADVVTARHERVREFASAA